MDKSERRTAALHAAGYAFLAGLLGGMFGGRHTGHGPSIFPAWFGVLLVTFASIVFAVVVYVGTYRSLEPREVICPKCLVTYDNRARTERCPVCNVATEAMPSFRKHHPSRFTDFDKLT